MPELRKWIAHSQNGRHFVIREGDTYASIKHRSKAEAQFDADRRNYLAAEAASDEAARVAARHARAVELCEARRAKRSAAAQRQPGFAF